MIFKMQSQLPNTFWCWAAVASSVDHFFSPSSFRPQCAVAQIVHGHSQCCDLPTPDACDQPNSLTTALKSIRHLDQAVAGSLAFPRIRAEIDSGRVVCARIGWFGSGGHFVVISGYGIASSGEPWLVIDDPLFGQDLMPLPEFRDAYRAQGSWSHSYFLVP